MVKVRIRLEEEGLSPMRPFLLIFSNRKVNCARKRRGGG